MTNTPDETDTGIQDCIQAYNSYCRIKAKYSRPAVANAAKRLAKTIEEFQSNISKLCQTIESSSLTDFDAVSEHVESLAEMLQLERESMST